MRNSMRKRLTALILCLTMSATAFTALAEELPSAGPQYTATEVSTDANGELVFPDSSEADPDGESQSESQPAAEEPAEDEDALSIYDYLSIRESLSAAKSTVVITDRFGKTGSADFQNNMLRSLRMRKIAELSKLNIIVNRGNGYVNVRAESNASSEILGKMYYNSTAEVINSVYEENGLWYHIRSGELDGYVKAEFFESGYAAADIISSIVNTYATVNTDGQRVYREASQYSDVLAAVDSGHKYQVISRDDSYTKIVYASGERGEIIGFVPSGNVTLSWEQKTAVSLEAEKQDLEEHNRVRDMLASLDYDRSVARSLAEEESRKKEIAESISRAEAEERYRNWLRESASRQAVEDESRAAAARAEASRRAAAEASRNAQAVQNVSDYQAYIPSGTSDLRRRIVVNALQYVNVLPYVFGGESLTYGTDCSGFMMLIFRQYGISVPHYSYHIAHTGVKVPSLSQARPGDIVCYNTWNEGSGRGHVIMYIGRDANGTHMGVEAPREGLKVRVTPLTESGLHTIQNVIGD